MSNDKPTAMHGCVGLIVIAVFCVMCGGCGIGWMTGGIHFSDGFREGHVQKFSNKGWIWQTDEGELALPGLRTVGTGEGARITNTWEFSVPDPTIASQIQTLHQDELVRLHYSEYKFSPPWKGSTGYRITKVEKIPKERK